MNFPTPTPFPTPNATPALVVGIDPALFSQNLATQGVQWWQQINTATYIFSLLQLAALIIIIVAGITLITRALNDV